MNLLSKILFWSFTIGIGFVNPLFSVGLVILYYLPGIIKDICKSCNEQTPETNSFSEDVMEEMK